MPGPQTPYFDNAAEYDYKIIDPQNEFSEINKDLVTSNLDRTDIEILELADLLISKLNKLGMTHAKEELEQEISIKVNLKKSLKGFLLKVMRDKRQTMIQKYEEGKIGPTKRGGYRE